MKNYSLLILAVLLIFSSCRKETSVIDGEFSETEEIEGVFFQGTIQDSNGEGLQATIDIYQNENKIGTVNTDSGGQYLTEDIFIEPNVEVTFDISRTGYSNKYRRFTKGVGLHSNFNFNLISLEEVIDGPSTFIPNPGSGDLIKVSKTFLDVNGNPVPNLFCTVTYNHFVSNDISFSSGGIDFTNAEGYMEMLLPAGEELFHFVAAKFDDPNIECPAKYHFPDTILFNPFFEREYLGVVTENLEINDYPDIAIHPTLYSVKGTLLNCDNTPVVNGEATVRVTYAFGTFPNTMQFTTTNFSGDGNFELEFEICNYGEYSAELIGTGDDGMMTEFGFTGGLGGSDLPTLSTCGQTIEDDSYFNLKIGEVQSFDDIILSQTVVTETSILALGFHPDHGNIQLSVLDISVGPIPIDVLNLNLPNTKPYSFTSLNGELTLHVESIEDNYITATISGVTETTDLGFQEISGELYIQYQ